MENVRNDVVDRRIPFTAWTSATPRQFVVDGQIVLFDTPASRTFRPSCVDGAPRGRHVVRGGRRRRLPRLCRRQHRRRRNERISSHQIDQIDDRVDFFVEAFAIEILLQRSLRRNRSLSSDDDVDGIARRRG